MFEVIALSIVFKAAEQGYECKVEEKDRSAGNKYLRMITGVKWCERVTNNKPAEFAGESRQEGTEVVCSF